MSLLKFVNDCKHILSCLESILEIFHTAGAKLGVIFYKTFTKVSDKCSHCFETLLENKLKAM